MTNLPQICYILSRDDFFSPCLPTLDAGRIAYTLGPFCGDLLHKIYPQLDRSTSPLAALTAFRTIDWRKADYLLGEHLRYNHKVIFASNFIDQIQWLKKQFGSKVVTVACRYAYDTEDYALFCRWLAMDHVRKQQTGNIAITEHDRDSRRRDCNMIDHYTDHFYQTKFIDQQINDDFDCVIPLTDLFIREKFFQHLDRIDRPVLSMSAQVFYDQWLEQNNIKENQHENQ